jgi:hypothetical protein
MMAITTRKYLIIIVSLIGLFSCTNNKKNQKDDLRAKFKTPIVVDTLNRTRIKLETVWLQIGIYNPVYIGVRKDTIINSYRPNLKKYFVYEEGRMKFKRPDSTQILLVVDTTRIVSEHAMIWEDDGSMYNEKSFEAFPVFVVNTTKDTLDIGYGDHLPIEMEAINTKGHWEQIEIRYRYMCGTGLNSTLLPPNEIVVTTAPLYHGNYKTKLRLRYHKTISNEFNGKINLTQFESRWDENHNPKPLPKKK